jgi:phosphoesterase RecJ-like protein
MALETDKNVFFISFRAREGFDTSQIAEALGGGGHKAASGARIVGKSFNEALDLTLRMARKYAKSTK